MFGKKRDDEIAAEHAKEAAEASPRNYQRSDATGAQPASRPALNPEIARRGPDLSVFGPGRGAQPAAAATEKPRATSTASMEPEHKKLIVGRDISLNGEIRTCDTLVVEGRVKAVLQDCKNIEIMGPGEFKGAAEVDVADISGRFDGDLTARQRLIVRTGGKVLG